MGLLSQRVPVTQLFNQKLNTLSIKEKQPMNPLGVNAYRLHDLFNLLSSIKSTKNAPIGLLSTDIPVAMQ